MKPFLNKDFLLETDTARQLYHSHAAHQPIIDYHCHLSPQDIAQDRQFNNLTEIWLEGDHYKWRAMRTHGVAERFCTGAASPEEKFEKWAETVPYTLRNPLYHWTHLELQRYFGLSELLSPATAKSIYGQCTEMLQTPEFSVRNLLRKMKVEVVCSTDDPTDTLEHHISLRQSGFEIKILPAFRPDKALAIGQGTAWNAYIDKLEAAAGMNISRWADLLEALQKRVDFFHECGGRLSDHGLENIPAVAFDTTQAARLFDKARNGGWLSPAEAAVFSNALLLELCRMYHAKGWTQQFHLGALRGNSTRMKQTLGPDTGFDSIGDFEMAAGLARFLDQLDQTNQLAKTILYNLNPRDNELFATMIGNFNDGSVPGKMQFGSGWWFLDQKDGMERQMNALSNMGLLPHFVGMLTDSRSFLSYPRHEYFRRILCNLFGNDVESGQLPAEMLGHIGQVVENICYRNARSYFGFYE